MNVHFLFDEVAALGHAPQALKDAIAIGRGYGIRTQWYVQSLGQLKSLFPEDEGQTLQSNTSQILFGVNDYVTAEAVSKRLGKSTITVESGGTSTGTSYQESSSKGGTSHSRNRSTNWSQKERELLQPDEILALDPREAIIFMPGRRPMTTRLLRYYEEKLSPPMRLAEAWAAVSLVMKAAVVLIAALMLAFLTMKAVSEGGRYVGVGGKAVWSGEGHR